LGRVEDDLLKKSVAMISPTWFLQLRGSRSVHSQNFVFAFR